VSLTGTLETSRSTTLTLGCPPKDLTMANPSPMEGLDINAEYFKLKREGNEFFHKDELDKAKDCYLKAMECLPGPPKEVLEV